MNELAVSPHSLSPIVHFPVNQGGCLILGLKYHSWLNSFHCYFQASNLDSKTKNANDAVHCFILPSNSAASISCVVPVARVGHVQTSSIFLHDHTIYNVLEWLAQFSKLVKTLLNNITGPLVHFIVLVWIASNCCFNGFFNDVADFVIYECRIFSSSKITIHDNL